MNIEKRHELWLQYRILDRLEPGHGWDKSAEILQKGFEAEYDGLTVQFYDPVSKDDAEFLHQIFCRFEALQDSIEALGLLDDELSHRAKFIGFDFNDSYENGLAGYAEFLFKEGRWTSQKPAHGLNSHARCLERYRDMVDRFSAWSGARDYRKEPLTEPEIRAIVG